MNYCKLYIATEIDQAELESEFSRGFDECVQLRGVEYTLFPNDLHQTGSRYLLDPVARSNFYVEIDSDPDVSISPDMFNAAIARLIIWLRHRYGYVVASCGFEDYIVEATGWNWTAERPLPDQV